MISLLENCFFLAVTQQRSYQLYLCHSARVTLSLYPSVNHSLPHIKLLSAHLSVKKKSIIKL